MSIPSFQNMKLRYIPQVPQEIDLVYTEGGMYASANQGPGNPLQIEPDTPSFVKYQTWRIGGATEDGTPILYTGDFEGGFHNDSNDAGCPVTLGDLSSYHIDIQQPIHGGWLILIRVLGGPLGVDKYIGVDDSTNTIVIKSFRAGTSEGLPGWFASLRE
ncbi:peptidase inhibitor clitocypin domain-containing protein [Ceratobasidium sp. AG-Ba]|nr:peptidase inhibitor clitocypin domain-containing protein [Ceratobasidium sp. AG-Ba]